MNASTFTRSGSTFRTLSFHLSVNFARCCCLVVSMLIISGGSLFTLGQTNKPITATSELYQNTTNGNNNNNVFITTDKPVASNSSFLSQQQPKSYKFTLIAGKLWKFNIKANSFHTHKEGELRLHKNVSTNNYIIDDDGWFQYNPQQQQLFAWPSLITKPGTYYFVLLPSGIDFEADSENTVNLDVVANIVVELIRPIYQGIKSDIDQLIDHKFSLDYLHRHSSYPLLLQQIVSVMETVSRTGNSAQQPDNITTLTKTSASSSLSSLLAQQKNFKFANRLNEYLLISHTYSSDGELFSLTWSLHPALINNTITPISECRLATINEIVTKLSIPASGYQIGDEKFVIYYPLDASFLSNSQAIVPTERGNHALKLAINGPCRRPKIFEELGLVSMTTYTASNLEDRDNNIVDIPATSKITYSSTLEAIDSNTAAQIATTTKSPSITITTPATTTTTTGTNAEPTTKVVLEDDDDDDQFSIKPRTHVPATGISSNQTAAAKINTTSLQAQVAKVEAPHVLLQQPKTQPQAKSFANFLDSTDTQVTNLTMAMSIISASSNSSNMTEIVGPTTNSPSISIVSTGDTNSTSESSLNEDFMGILNYTMEYLVSVAIPVSIIVGTILVFSITIAVCSLCIKKRKSKQFQVNNRFNFRYGSERRAFMKNSSKPVILEADQKSLSFGGTPKHQSSRTKDKKSQRHDNVPMTTYFRDTANDDCDDGDCDGGDN